MNYILISKNTQREHLVDEKTYQMMRKKTNFHRKYDVQPIAVKKVGKPIELVEPTVYRRKKRVEEPKTEEND